MQEITVKLLLDAIEKDGGKRFLVDGVRAHLDQLCTQAAWMVFAKPQNGCSRAPW